MSAIGGGVDAILGRLRQQVGTGGVAPWPARNFGARVPAVASWQGVSADSAHDASTALNAQRQSMTEAHSAAGRLVDRAGEVATTAQSRIDAIIAQWQTDKAALEPFAGTPSGMAALLRAGQLRVSEAVGVVKAAIAQYAALAAELEAVTAQVQQDTGRRRDPTIQALDNPDERTTPKPEPATGGGEKRGKEDKPGGKRGAKIGKPGSTQIQPSGEPERTWGTPTDPHEIWPDNPYRDGTFDAENGEWRWQGPGRQGGAHAAEYEDGFTGEAGVGGWLVKGETAWGRDVFGRPLTGSASGQIGADANATGTVTEHGISGHLDAFIGAELGGKGEYDLGPIDISLGLTGQLGYGGAAGIDFGEQDGKFVMGGSLGYAPGLGGKIAPKIAVDYQEIGEFILRANDWLKGLS